MNANYLDPSAWVKRYFQEVGTENVATIFSGSDLIACSRFGIVEVAATIARKGTAERLSADTINSLRKLADEDFAAFTLIAVTEALLISAQTLAFDYGLRAGDAVHLASALMLSQRQGVTSVTVVSADIELLVAAQRAQLLTLNPNVAP